MRSIPCSTSRANSIAAVALRARYHSAAPVSSARASGWNSTFAIQASVKIGPDLLPWNRLHLARIELTDPTLDLFRPRCLNVLIGLALEAFEQKTGKFCPLSF